MSEMLIMTLEFPLSDSRKRSGTLTSRQRDLSSVPTSSCWKHLPLRCLVTVRPLINAHLFAALDEGFIWTWSVLLFRVSFPTDQTSSNIFDTVESV